MATRYILYNPKAGATIDCQKLIALVEDPNKESKLLDVTQIQDYQAFFANLASEDDVVLCGGDGTLNRFVNNIDGVAITNEFLYYPSGTGNDFANDLEKSKGCQPFSISAYINDLPTVTVKGKTSRFVNGIGYGIDGYCCEVGDQLKKKNKKVNYTAIALKGLFGGYHTTGATVTVDGVSHEYKKVWMVPTMHGRYFGGGMMPAPNQDRCGEEKTLSVMVVHDSPRLKTLIIFPTIFQGKHIKHTDIVDVFTGHEISVTFDRPTALQVDGETVLAVTSYNAKSAGAAVKNQEQVIEEKEKVLL